MKVFVAITHASEFDGRVSSVRPDKAFLSAAKAEEWLRGKPGTWRETIDGFDCFCQRGVMEVEVEE